MEDLSNLKWPSQPKSAQKTQHYTVPSHAIATLRPTPPASGGSSPLPRTSSSLSSKTQTPANDSFSNLVSFNSGSANKNLSLQEQQRKLLEEKAQQQAAKQKQLQSQFSGGDEQFWNNLGSGRSTPASPPVVSGTRLPVSSGGLNQKGTPSGGLSQSNTEDEDDILAAFRADAPVDSSSHFPKPFERSSLQPDAGQRITSPVPVLGNGNKSSTPDDLSVFDDDDLFGLAGLSKKPYGQQHEPRPQVDEDDVLGLLGRPVSELSQPRNVVERSSMPNEPTTVHPQDRAMAELMEMAFPTEKAREALESTESGIDVQQAVSWLLNKAHSDSRNKGRARRSSKEGCSRQGRDPRVDRKAGSRPRLRQREGSDQAWSKERYPQENPHQTSTVSASSLERDPAQIASEFGTAFLKTAGSLWKTSTKKVQQAVQDFNSDSDSSQPKWMRERKTSATRYRSGRNEGEEVPERPRRRSSENKKLHSATDEALMLESDRSQPPPRKPPRRQELSVDSSADSSRDHSPALPSRLRQEIPVQPAYLPQQLKPQSRVDNKPALNRQTIDGEASQAYTSSARRRKAAKTPATAPEPDLLEGTSQPALSVTTSPAPTRSLQHGRATQPSERASVRSPAPPRNIPAVSSMSLKASHNDREAGNQHFKRGDYSAAHQFYTASLKHLPTNHPIAIILHTNRALTDLKIGEPKTAISDSDRAISIIGSSRGEAETIDLSDGELPKPMREYLGKALMRKAEALEQMEKWKEAAAVWQEAVEGGHGGTTSIQGRLRCEKAAALHQFKGPKPPPITKSTTRTPVRSAISDRGGTAAHISSSAAVNRLRSANADADREDDEKFALADTVEAKLIAWKGGKADNLRALLGSLDAVLWPEAGWKKIGMADLVLPARVKVHYMKGIAKVHPDKLATTATTEQRMIAGAVFSTLNEAWDKFKAENGL